MRGSNAWCPIGPDQVYKRSLDGRAEARLIALACSVPPEGRDRWGLRLLVGKAVELVLGLIVGKRPDLNLRCVQMFE